MGQHHNQILPKVRLKRHIRRALVYILLTITLGKYLNWIYAGSKGDAMVNLAPSAGRVLSQKFPDTDIPGILRDIALELEK